MRNLTMQRNVKTCYINSTIVSEKEQANLTSAYFQRTYQEKLRKRPKFDKPTV